LAWSIEHSAGFEDDLRLLRKRFRKVAEDIHDEFKNGPPNGWAIPGFKELLWKARIPSTDLQKGKSHGFRVIYYWDKESPNSCCLGACYFKGDTEDLPIAQVRELFVKVKAVVDRLKAELEKKKKAAEEKPAEDKDPGL
jgi:mRNA-degrading endonuclease RelE of RelBE toxin-antitoxin system